MIGLLLIVAASAAGAAPTDDVVVRAQIPPHCHSRPGDPLDAVEALPTRWVTLRAKRDGSVAIAQDGPHLEQDTQTWQRSGKDLADFLFRAPTDDNPLCIGSKGDQARGVAQLRRQLNPLDFRGRRIRFTAFAATRNARSASFWINGGGGHFNQVELDGTHGWTPVSIQVDVSDRYPTAMYGFTLSGGGDVWLYQPHLDIIGPNGKPLPSPPDRR